MKNVTKVLFAALLLSFAAGARAEDKYDQLAKDLTEAGASVQGKKIAVIPFSYADNRGGASKDGSIIAERLTIKMINMHKFEIIERSVLDKVMAELKLQSSGMIDASSAQQLGKVLGVEAIVTGTLVETSNGQIEVNARLIKTETAQAIGASQVTLEKNWIGDVSSAPQQPVQPQQPAYQQPVYQQPVYQQPAAKAGVSGGYPRSKYEYGFFDVFMGFGSPTMSLSFTNSGSRGIYLYDLGVSLVGGANYGPLRSVKWDSLATQGSGPIAMRIGGFGKGAVGGDFEFSYQSTTGKAQNTTWSFNDGAKANFYNFRSDYVSVKTFGMSGDLLFRVPGETVDPYFGFGLGMSLNTVDLPYVKGYTNGSFVPPTNDLGLGLMFRIPIGMRIKIADKTQIVTELRYEINSVHFDRGAVSGESDTVTTRGAKFLIGMGFGF
jgi:TolB-like protein